LCSIYGLERTDLLNIIEGSWITAQATAQFLALTRKTDVPAATFPATFSIRYKPILAKKLGIPKFAV
jgi:hypothetical protein